MNLSPESQYQPTAKVKCDTTKRFTHKTPIAFLILRTRGDGGDGFRVKLISFLSHSRNVLIIITDRLNERVR